MTTDTVRTGLVEANGAQLYHEIRGDGPPVIFVPGGIGDGGMFDGPAELLADTYTTVAYDRRGNSRSPRPDGWTSTSVYEHADDVVALIDALGFERPIAVGCSHGGTILAGLMPRHPGALRGAILHEPGLTTVAPSHAAFQAAFEVLVAETVGSGADPEEMVKTLGRFMFGDAIDAIPGDLWTRMLANNEVTETIDRPCLDAFVPDERALRAVGIPVHAAYGEETTDPNTWLVEAAQWVAKVTGGELHVMPGGHFPYVDRPAAFADALRPILEEIP